MIALDEIAEEADLAALREAMQPDGSVPRIGIHGTVSVPTGLEPATVYVLGQTSGSLARLSIGRCDASGNYELDVALPSFPAVSRWIQIGAMTPGALRTVKRLEVRPGGEYRLDFELTSGHTLAGRVVDTRGLPVADLPVYATSRELLPSVVVSRLTLDNHELMFAAADSTYHEGRAVTDAAGRFSIQGLGLAKYGVFSEAAEWFIRQEGRLQPGTPETDVVAVPALTVAGSVIDQHSGDDVERFRIAVSVDTPSGRSYERVGSGENGRLYLSWIQQREEATAGCTLHLTIDSPLHARAHRSISMAPGVLSAETDFSLQRVAQGSAEFFVCHADGSQVGFALMADLVSRSDKHVRRGGVQLGTQPSGSHTLRGPVGPWFVRIYPAHPLGRTLSWIGEVDLRKEDPMRRRVALPECGTLLVKIHGGAGLVLVVSSSDRNTSLVHDVDEAEWRWEGVPVGEWEFSLLSKDGTTLQRQSARVFVNDTTAVELSR